MRVLPKYIFGVLVDASCLIKGDARIKSRLFKLYVSKFTSDGGGLSWMPSGSSFWMLLPLLLVDFIAVFIDLKRSVTLGKFISVDSGVPARINSQPIAVVSNLDPFQACDIS